MCSHKLLGSQRGRFQVWIPTGSRKPMWCRALNSKSLSFPESEAAAWYWRGLLQTLSPPLRMRQTDLLSPYRVNSLATTHTSATKTRNLEENDHHMSLSVLPLRKIQNGSLTGERERKERKLPGAEGLLFLILQLRPVDEYLPHPSLISIQQETESKLGSG